MTRPFRPAQYHAVRHILSAPLIDERTRAYVGDEDIDWVGIEREAVTMSDGGRFLIRVATDLWTAERRTGVSEIPRKLDEENFERVLDALRMARGAAVAA